MQTQRFFELRDCAGNVAFAHENFTEVIMRLGELWIKLGGRLKMLLCSCEVAVFQERGSKIYLRIDYTRIKADCFSILRSGLIQFAVFFQKSPKTMVSRRRFWRQTDRGFA